MTTRAAHRHFSWWILRVHWLLGIAALAIYTQTSIVFLLLLTTTLAAGTWMDAREMPRKLFSRMSAVIVVFLLAASAIYLFFVGGDLMSCASFMLIGIQSFRMLSPKGVRESWQLSALSFLDFLIAASVADEMSFAFFAFIFLAACIGAMWSLHSREAQELGRPPGGYMPSLKTSVWAFLLLSAGGFLMSAVLFAAVPRLEFRRAFLGSFSKNAISGFSDTITLDEITGIKSDYRIVARVEFPFLEGEPITETFYLKGAVYSRYSDGRWQSSKLPPFPVMRSGFNYIFRETPQSAAIVADITLESASHPRLFIYGAPLQIEIGANAGPLYSDWEGNLFLSQEGHPTLRYRLMFTNDPRPQRRQDANLMRQYLEFPSGYEDIRSLAIKTVKDANTDEERADLLLGFFQKEFIYSLNRPASTLRSFLFEEKRGYCEHYAAGLALLLRAAGIPSRVAVGYLGGEWNVLGRYLIVRQSNAHAWVEAWIGEQWVTLDATPPQTDESFLSRKLGVLGSYVDWLRHRWNNYVINYSLRTQANVVRAGMSGLKRISGPKSLPGLPWILPVAAAAVFSRLLWKAWRTRERKVRDKDRLPASYDRLLRRLEKAGYRPSRGIPMAEMVETAVRTRPDLTEEARAFLSLYHLDRFGSTPLPPELRAKAALMADRLKSRISV